MVIKSGRLSLQERKVVKRSDCNKIGARRLFEIDPPYYSKATKTSKCLLCLLNWKHSSWLLEHNDRSLFLIPAWNPMAGIQITPEIGVKKNVIKQVVHKNWPRAIFHREIVRNLSLFEMCSIRVSQRIGTVGKLGPLIRGIGTTLF